jgi:hypothetical protein
VFKLKRDEAGAIIKHKAHLVARGFMQREGIDFDDTFAQEGCPGRLTCSSHGRQVGVS